MDWSQLLANAIIEQAAHDYILAQKRLRKNPDDEKAQDLIDETTAFFLSKWFSEITDVDAGYCLKLLNEKVDQNAKQHFRKIKKS